MTTVSGRPGGGGLRNNEQDTRCDQQAQYCDTHHLTVGGPENTDSVRTGQSADRIPVEVNIFRTRRDRSPGPANPPT